MGRSRECLAATGAETLLVAAALGGAMQWVSECVALMQETAVNRPLLVAWLEVASSDRATVGKGDWLLDV